MTTKKPKLLGVFTVPSGGYIINIVRTDIAGTSTDVTLPAGDYFMSGEAASDPDDAAAAGDLTYRLQVAVVAAHAELANFTCTIDSDGVVSMALAGLETATLTWLGVGLTGEPLRDQLGYEGVTASLTAVDLDGTLVAKTSYWSPIGVQNDEPVDETVRASSQAVDGTTYAVNLGEIRRIKFAVWVPGWWRREGDQYYHRMHDLFRFHMLFVLRFRYYIDKTATGEFNRNTNGNGYHTVTLGLEHKEWDIPKVKRQRKTWYDGAWMFDYYIAPT